MFWSEGGEPHETHSLRQSIPIVEVKRTERLTSLLAAIYIRSGRLDDAIRLCTDELEHDPCHENCRTLLGKTYYVKGRLQEAKIELERALVSCPHDPQITDLLCRIEFKTPARKKGLKPVSMPDDKEAELPRSHEGRGGRPVEVQVPEEVRVPEEGHDGARIATKTMAMIFLAQGYLDQAEEMCLAISKRNPADRWVEKTLAEIRGRRGTKGQ